MDTESPVVDLHRHLGLAHLALRPSVYADEGFVADTPTWNQVRILVVGAGGLGCELLHCLALSGFTDIEIIDMDTIDLSNLNRQFLFRQRDIGKPKADVAAAFITRRYPHVVVRPHHKRIEDMGDEWYRSFHLILMGLDSVTARAWLNRKIASLTEFVVDGANGAVTVSETIPIIDSGTEGFRGSMRHIRIGQTACIECAMWLYPPPLVVPMCTLENVPRTIEHCVLYVKEKTWQDAAPFGKKMNTDGTIEAVDVDGDNPDHITWIAQQAAERQRRFGLEGAIDFRFTQGIVKSVVPAVGFTNAIMSAMAVNEALKITVGITRRLDSYTFYDGSANGVASYAQQLAPDPLCSVCQTPTPLPLSHSATLADVMNAIMTHERSRDITGGASSAPGREASLSATLRNPLTGYRGATHQMLVPRSHPLHATIAALFDPNMPLLESLVRLEPPNECPDAADPTSVVVDADVSGGVFGNRSLRYLVHFPCARGG